MVRVNLRSFTKNVAARKAQYNKKKGFEHNHDTNLNERMNFFLLFQQKRETGLFGCYFIR